MSIQVLGLRDQRLFEQGGFGASGTWDGERPALVVVTLNCPCMCQRHTSAANCGCLEPKAKHQQAIVRFKQLCLDLVVRILAPQCVALRGLFDPKFCIPGAPPWGSVVVSPSSFLTGGLVVRTQGDHPATLNRSTLPQAMCLAAGPAAVAMRKVALARLAKLWTNEMRLAAICTVVAAHGQGGTPPADLPKPDAPEFLDTCAEAVPEAPVTTEDARAAWVQPKGSGPLPRVSRAQIDQAMEETRAAVTLEAVVAVMAGKGTGPELRLADAMQSQSLLTVLTRLHRAGQLEWWPAAPSDDDHAEHLIGLIVECLRTAADSAAPTPATGGGATGGGAIEQRAAGSRTRFSEYWLCPHDGHKHQAVYADKRSENRLCHDHRNCVMPPGWTFRVDEPVEVSTKKGVVVECRGEWVRLTGT